MTTIYIIAFLAGAAILIYLTIQYSLLIPSTKGLPIFMYHKVSESNNDNLTVSVSKLEQQFEYFKEKKYIPISFKKLKEHVDIGSPLPKNPIIITFDDGYINNYELAVPLLRKFNYPATIFLPVSHIGGTNEWDGGGERLMDYPLIKELTSSGLVDFGLHSYNHKSYKRMTLQEIEEDVLNCVTKLDENSMEYVKVIAYPYGGFPRKDKELNKNMKDVFEKNKIDFAVRIGSKINKLPIKDRYELKRIDVRGSDKDFEFKIKCKKGRTKLF